MKRADLIRAIEDAGCEFVRHGGKHDWYRNLTTGISQPVSRHREIKDRLALAHHQNAKQAAITFNQRPCRIRGGLNEVSFRSLFREQKVLFLNLMLRELRDEHGYSKWRLCSGCCIPMDYSTLILSVFLPNEGDRWWIIWSSQEAC